MFKSCSNTDEIWRGLYVQKGRNEIPRCRTKVRRHYIRGGSSKHAGIAANRSSHFAAVRSLIVAVAPTFPWTSAAVVAGSGRTAEMSACCSWATAAVGGLSKPRSERCWMTKAPWDDVTWVVATCHRVCRQCLCVPASLMRHNFISSRCVRLWIYIMNCGGNDVSVTTWRA